MKMGTYHKALIIVLLALANFNTNYAQGSNEGKKQREIQNLIQSGNYVFVAQNVMPLGGRTINLTSIYDLQVLRDTVISNLPYFGRAFVAPMNPSEGGIRFTSTDFDYKVKDRKGGWDIAITPKDAKDVRQMLLSITESGYGNLQVISNNRQQISYNGYVMERKGRI